jgi:hypothetical protein
MRKHYRKPKSNRSYLAPVGVGVCLGGALLAGAPGTALAQATSPADAARLEKLEKENQELRKRLDALEQKEGIAPSGAAAATGPQPVKALSAINISGFVTASYFYDTSDPPNQTPPGYLWNRTMNSFWLNKFKLTLESAPVERSAEKWDAGYKASLIFGQDAPIVDTGGEAQGMEAVREAYVELNVPIGTGLDVRVGQLISLLNFESGDGGAVNANFSQGNQWYFTGNGPSGGLQLGYQFTDWFSSKVRVQNGLYTGSVDNNSYKTMMGSFNFTPDSKTSINLIGFGGRESNDSGLWLKGGSLIASRKLMDKYNVNVATEFDYFNQDVPGSTVDWWSIGGWIWADFVPQFGVAFRADYLADPEGAGTSGLLGFPVNNGQDLYSLTFTVNWRPTPNIKVQPEVRFDHTTLNNGFGTQQDRFVLGAGVSYLF